MIEEEEKTLQAFFEDPIVKKEVSRAACLYGRSVKEERQKEIEKKLNDLKHKHQMKMRIAGVLPSDIRRGITDRGLQLPREVADSIYQTLAEQEHIAHEADRGAFSPKSGVDPARVETFFQFKETREKFHLHHTRGLSPTQLKWVVQVLREIRKYGSANIDYNQAAANVANYYNNQGINLPTNAKIEWVIAADNYLSKSRLPRLDLERLRGFFSRNTQQLGSRLTDHEVVWVYNVLREMFRNEENTLSIVHARKLVDPEYDIDGDDQWVQMALDWLEQTKIPRKDFITALSRTDVCTQPADLAHAVIAFRNGENVANAFVSSYDFCSPILDRVINEEKRLEAKNKNTSIKSLYFREALGCADCSPVNNDYERRKKELRQLALYNRTCT